MDFKRVDRVEVSSKEEGFVGSYYSATILAKLAPTNELWVEYETLCQEEDETKLPFLPEIKLSEYSLLDKVDAYDNDGWWIGRISAVLDDSMYYVYFENSRDEIAYPVDKLRIHQEFDNGKWFTIDQLIVTGDSDQILQKAIQQHGRGQVMNTLTEIQERHGAVRDVESKLLELQQIFMDMAVLVETQGDMLDNIESQDLSAVDHVQSGAAALQKEKKLERNSRKWILLKGLVNPRFMLLIGIRTLKIELLHTRIPQIKSLCLDLYRFVLTKFVNVQPEDWDDKEYIDDPEDKKPEVEQLRKRFIHSIAPRGLAGDRQYVVPASGFSFSAQQIC
ncbi:hypothetical protein C5167_051086 [Papaver somniferum]|uniref:t-SNARE coiled-coil homology domain-containing protein n=1 Tax=Papaver somniferum TaxID=3469 RepID=A0A4Y7KT71_PAPSO|nr:hypothetical protein C5167_051086 [Papaver somniferum]